MNFFKKIFEKVLKKESPKDNLIKKDSKELSSNIGDYQKDIQKSPENKIDKTDEEIISELNTVAPGIFSQAKTPEAKKLIIKIYRKMLEDGVDFKNEKEVEKWMHKNKHLFSEDIPKVETYRRETPKIGRNEPCPCGSGKKYKKCCGTKN